MINKNSTSNKQQIGDRYPKYDTAKEWCKSKIIA